MDYAKCPNCGSVMIMALAGAKQPWECMDCRARFDNEDIKQ